MNRHGMNRIALMATLALLTGTGGTTTAQATGMTLHGTLIAPPPCTINDGNTIDVDFGKVGIKKIDGVNYRKALNYRISCEKGSTAWVLKLTLTGNATAFDKEALMSNRGVGIRMYQNNKPFTPNSTIDINLNSPPALAVVPVKDAAKDPEKGDFMARATLRADYQ